uniref:Aminopeptidase n=1 Tax=Panagrellus redivivus TaxID=6233 RepID=A0A7E4UYJ8_PANRE
MPSSSHSRRSRSTRDDDQSSQSYADEASTESGDVESVKKDQKSNDYYQRLREVLTPKNVFLYLGLTSVIIMVILGIFTAAIVYLSQSIEFDDLELDCESVFGKSDHHIAAEKYAKKAYKELNETKALLSNKSPYDIPSLLTFKHPDLVLSGDDVGVDQYLPKNIYPYHYDVKLRVQLPVNGNNDFKISGHVRIEFNVTKNTKRVYFNARDINIENAEDWRHRKLHVAKGDHSEVRYVEVPDLMEVGKKYHIELDFVSQFYKGMEGLYLSRYLDTSGRVHYTASTQFESMNARRLFPCLDEPYYRSSFTFVVEHPPSYDAFSNMPNVSRTLIEGGQFTQTTFAPLPNSPTYILALLIADDYAVRSTKTKDGTEIRMLARNEFIDDTKPALDFGVKVLEWFNEKFQIPYPLPKIDIAGIYSFEAGAMENYGLTTYRENIIFTGSKYSDVSEHDYKRVIAHEFAHQWFGNLVTPEDWSQIFMNEGFANFFESYAVFAIDGGLETYSMSRAIHIPVFLNDAKQVHPNDFVSDSNLELRYYFDGVTYSRGGAVFNMIRGIVGDDIFFAALRSYLSANKNGHAHWRKLAHALQKVIPKNNELSKIDFEAFFKAWLTVPGFPVVNVKKEGKKFTLKASLFLKLSDPIMDRRWPLGQTWPIPIWYRVSSDILNLKFVMMEPGKELVIDVPGKDDVIFVNSENHGYYIVNYEGQLFEKVRDALATEGTHFLSDAVIRFQVDACPLLLTGVITSKTYFDSLNTHKNGAKLIPTVARMCGYFIEGIVKDTEVSSIHAKHMHDFLEDAIKSKMEYRISDIEINADMEEAELSKIDRLVEKLSCKLDQTKCTAKENYNFEKYVMDCRPTDQTADCVKLNVTEREQTYCQGIKTNNRKYYEQLVQLFTNSRNTFEANRLMNGLICSKESQLLAKLFTLFTTPNDHVNKAESLNYFETLSFEHPELTRKLFLHNVNQIVNDFPSSAAAFLYTALISNTEKDYLEVVQLLHDNRTLLNRFAHVFRDILNDSRTALEAQKKVLPGIIQYFKEYHTSQVVPNAKDPSLCENFGSCI